MQSCEQLVKDIVSQNPDLLDESSKQVTSIPKLIKLLSDNIGAWQASECYASLWRKEWIDKLFVNFQTSHWAAESSEVSAPSKQDSSSIDSDNYSENKTYGMPSSDKEDYVELPNQTKTTTTTTATISQPQQSFWDELWVAQMWYYLKMWFYIFLILVAIVSTWKLIRYFFSFLYDVLNSRRLIFLKVILPRWDSKLDREKEKELAKDMKEKIARMSQVYRNMYKLKDSFFENWIMRPIFSKPKVTIMMHYEKWIMQFIIWIYPEYKKIIEWAIAAQYSEASIETTTKPNLFSKQYDEIVPLEPVKDVVYPIRTFKQLEDDPINNIIDAVGKISTEDTFTMLLTIKPESDTFNERAKRFADGLNKKDKSITDKTSWWKYIVMPWKMLDFLATWPSDWLLKQFAPKNWQWDPMIRMTKAEEEAIGVVAEEAWKPAFKAWLLLISSSDQKDRVKDNLQNVMGAFTVYRDEYNNELDTPNVKADVFWFIFKPLWRFSVIFCLTNFFYRKNIFTVNQLSSVYHLPDWMFNRSPIIKWMDYKVIAAPDNVPVCSQESWFYITWIVAEEYKKWVISEIFKWTRHRAVWEKTEQVEELVEITDYKQELVVENEWKNYYPHNWQHIELVEKDGKNFVRTYKEVKKTWLKVFKDWILLWVNVHRNIYTPIYIKRDERTRHQYIIWKSGWGKSVFIASLARQDIWNWDWLCVIDPHGDLVEDIMEYIPKERAKDVIYFDAWNEDRPMWLNLYEIDNPDQADRVVNDATEIFLKMFGWEIFGPRIQEYFKYWSLTLLEDLEEWCTLLDVPRLFTDEVFREYKTKKVKNPVVKNFWEKTYNAMGDREKQEIIPYFTSKFVSFNTNRLIRNIIGQTKSAFKFRPAMDSGKILLINLSKWKIWELNAQLLWMIIVSQVYNAAMSRADVPQKDRRDFYLYVDEFQNFVSWTFADILSEARKYRLGLIMAHQYIAQLEDKKAEWWKADVKKAVFGNVGTMQSFKVWAEDAEFLEKEYAPVLSAQDIIGISNYKVYIKLNINNATSRVFSMDTIWTTDYRNKKIADVIKEYSAKKYWRKREFVDAEIAAKLWLLWEEWAEDQILQGQQPVEATA